jgi:hypothetical protein
MAKAREELSRLRGLVTDQAQCLTAANKEIERLAGLIREHLFACLLYQLFTLSQCQNESSFRYDMIPRPFGTSGTFVSSA